MKIINLLLFVAVFTTVFQNIHAQTAPTIVWQKSLGGSGEDKASNAFSTPDGGYIVAGSSNSNDGDVSGNHGGYDVWLVKLDYNGNKQWQKSLGGSGDEEFYGLNLQLAGDGGYIVGVSSNSRDGDVTGYQSSGGGGDIWIAKLDSLGNIQWNKCYGGPNGDQIGFNGLQSTNDGGYIIAGFTFNTPSVDILVIKINNSGDVQWQKTYGGSGTDFGNVVRQTADGGYIVAGESTSANGNATFNHGGFDSWVLKLDSNGNLQWQKSYGGSQDESNTFAIDKTADGGYILAAPSNSNDGDVSGNHGEDDFCVYKLDGVGNIQWQKCYGGSGDELPSSIKQVSDGGYIITGGSSSNDQQVSGHHGNTDQYDCWIIKINSAGSILWQNSYGGSLDDNANSIQPTSDGGWIMSGLTMSNNGDVSGHHGSVDFWDYWVVKLQDNNVLPVTLLSFTAQLQKDNTLLQWETGTESNTDYFNVQRSSDGVHFSTITKIAAAGNSSSKKSYTYTDAGAVELSGNKLYYRLQEVDKDNKSNYSEVRVIDFSKAHSLFSISPNPSKDFINITSAYDVTDAQVRITDMSGKALFAAKQNFSAGQQLKVSLSQFPSGILIVTIVGWDNHEQFKLVKN